MRPARTDAEMIAGRLGLGVAAVVEAGLSAGARSSDTYGRAVLCQDVVDDGLDARRPFAHRLTVEVHPPRC